MLRYSIKEFYLFIYLNIFTWGASLGTIGHMIWMNYKYSIRSFFHEYNRIPPLIILLHVKPKYNLVLIVLNVWPFCVAVEQNVSKLENPAIKSIQVPGLLYTKL